MAGTDIALIAHLMRRAGFGATRSELEELASKGYDAVVDDLLHPERFPEVEEDVLKRYYLELSYTDSLPLWTGEWMYRMINTKRPLEEKMALFWHHVFATAWYKGEHTPTMVQQINTFRNYGMGNVRAIFIELAKDPAMNYWLDNCENHNGAPNENWGRELLELFSMGVGNYTEDDIKDASRAFTGWTFAQPIPLYPYGHYQADFLFREDDHDNGEKTFLGETGNFNGEDIIDIIVRQPATARFIARHMYNFFVEDEAQVPSWHDLPSNNPEAVEALVTEYFDSDGDIRVMLRTLFTSEFFKNAQFKKVKSPTELVTGTIKMVGTYRGPDMGLARLGSAASVMGQQLMNPPTVEGWHTGHEWIDGGTLNERVNFAVNEIDASKPGIRDIIDRISAEGSASGGLTPEQFVERCVDLVGPIEVGADTESALLAFAQAEGDLSFDDREHSASRIARMLQLIVASREYQFA